MLTQWPAIAFAAPCHVEPVRPSCRPGPRQGGLQSPRALDEPAAPHHVARLGQAGEEPVVRLPPMPSLLQPPDHGEIAGTGADTRGHLHCDDTTHIAMQPQEFMQRLAALVPRPRLHHIRVHGLLARHAKLHAAVLPGTAKKPSERAFQHARRPARMSRARLLKRVFDIDVEHCACGGKPKTIAAIEEPTVIERILTHLGLSAQPPSRTPARRVELPQAA
jgi:hypothetical protein